MARSEIKTWLPLDRWAEIVGLHPLHFNGLASANLIPGTVCGDVWFQYSWQHSDRVGHEDVAMAIQQAEMIISSEVGFNLLPDWTVAERLPYPKPGVPGVMNLNGTNPYGYFNSVELRKGHVISGGVRAKSLIEAGAAYVRSDEDSDGFQETCTATVATTVTDENEIHLYYPAESGDDGWEIRPIKVTLSGGNAIITFKIWQISAANKMGIFDPQPLDAEKNASYESTVDVYRVYNDPATQVQFMWEGWPWTNGCGSCYACQFGTQAGCFHLREPRIGIAVPAPASWDSDNERFNVAEWSVCRAPDQVRFWYYSGFEDTNLTRSKVEMAKFWEYAVAFYAASLLDRDVCGCSNVQQFIDRWRVDAMANDQESISIQVTPELLSNKMGTTLGAIYAYKRVHQNGMRVIK